MQLVHLTFVFMMLSVLSGFASAADTGSANKAVAPRYTFSWPLDEMHLKPRGGSTKGASVTLETAPSPQWRALQQPGISDFERDRRAILAMAGIYRVTFDFLEVVSFKPLDKPIAPYQSWGTEKIYVDIDSGESIIVGLNRFADDGAASRIDTLRIDPAVEARQIERVRAVRARRSAEAAGAALGAIVDTARTGANLVPPIVAAVEAEATIGEICDAMRSVFGEYQETATI